MTIWQFALLTGAVALALYAIYRSLSAILDLGREWLGVDDDH